MKDISDDLHDLTLEIAHDIIDKKDMVHPFSPFILYQLSHFNHDIAKIQLPEPFNGVLNNHIQYIIFGMTPGFDINDNVPDGSFSKQDYFDFYSNRFSYRIPNEYSGKEHYKGCLCTQANEVMGHFATIEENYLRHLNIKFGSEALYFDVLPYRLGGDFKKLWTFLDEKLYDVLFKRVSGILDLVKPKAAIFLSENFQMPIIKKFFDKEDITTPFFEPLYHKERKLYFQCLYHPGARKMDYLVSRQYRFAATHLQAGLKKKTSSR